MSVSTTFEELPDELLLLICRYLSSTDILFSFNSLNIRLSQTISGFCQHVVLGQVPFKQFNSICTSILPNIGMNISSLVVSNDWKGILSTIFVNYFKEKMSLTFPHLKRLILPTFRVSVLISFLDCLNNLPELFEMKLMSLYEMGERSIDFETLLQRIFLANNNRLTSIIFDDDSLSFSFINRANFNYPHIEKLVIELTTVDDLHRILTVLPQLKLMDVTISEESDNKYIPEMSFTPILTLKSFRLRSFIAFWNMDTLLLILKRIPYVEELMIEIRTDTDGRLLNGQELYSHLSSVSLRKFSYFLLYVDPPIFLDTEDILTSWQQFNQQFVCLQSDDKKSLVLYTIPFGIPYLFLRYSLAKNQTFSDHYSSQLRSFTLYEVSTRIAETFSIINKCHRLERLVLRIDSNIVPSSFQQIQLCKLPFLTFFVSLDNTSVHADDLKKLLQASPNLYHLAINYEFLKSLLDDESICYLLKERISHILVGITSATKVESVIDSIPRLSTIVPSLKHFYFHTDTNRQLVEPLILTVFNYLSHWHRLVSFGVANITFDDKIVSKGIRQWVIENSSLKDQDSFVTDYSDDTFRLWL